MNCSSSVTGSTIQRIEAVKFPPRSLRANSYAEWFVLTARTEVTDRMLISDERHLRLILARYETNYSGRSAHSAQPRWLSANACRRAVRHGRSRWRSDDLAGLAEPDLPGHQRR